MTKIASVLFFTLSMSGWAQNPDEQAIRDVLAKQEECWNAGDLECFMLGYWKSDDLTFIGSKGVIHGWDRALENYQESYPDRATMGELTFTLIQLEPLSDDFWYVIGKWELARKRDKPAGHFTLLFRRLGSEWVIVSDHSSYIKPTN